MKAQRKNNVIQNEKSRDMRPVCVIERFGRGTSRDRNLETAYIHIMFGHPIGAGWLKQYAVSWNTN